MILVAPLRRCLGALRRAAAAASSTGLAGGAGLAGVATIVCVVLEYLIRRSIAARLGPESYGAVYAAVSGAIILARLSQLGAIPAVKRSVSLHLAEGRPAQAAASARAAITVVLGISLALAVAVTFAAPWVASQLLGGGGAAGVVVVAAWLVPGRAVIEVLQGVLFAMRRTAAAVLVSPGIDKGLTLAALLALPAIASSAAGAVAMVLAGVGAGVVLGAATLRSASFDLLRRGASTWAEAGALVRFSWPLQIAAIANLLAGRLDGALLGLWVGPSEVGYYHAALPLAEMVQVGLVAVLCVFIPSLMGPVSRGDLAAVGARYRQAQRWVFLVAGPILAVLLGLPRATLSIVYAPGFEPSSRALVILAVAFAIQAAAGPYVGVLVAVGRTRTCMAAGVAGLAAMLAVDVAFVPACGVQGAALGRVAAALVAAGVGLAGLARAMGTACRPVLLVRVTAASLVAAFAAACAGHAAGDAHPALALLAGIPCALTTFAGCAMALGAVTKDDFRWLRTRATRLLGA